jgi:hypothetical protein
MYGMYTWETPSPSATGGATTFSDLVAEARTQIHADAPTAGSDDQILCDGGSGAMAYADVVGCIYPSLLTKKPRAFYACTWSASPKNELVVGTFRRQALPMTGILVRQTRSQCPGIIARTPRQLESHRASAYRLVPRSPTTRCRWEC